MGALLVGILYYQASPRRVYCTDNWYSTRGFRLDDGSPCLVPVADMANHQIYEKKGFCSDWSDFYYDPQSSSFKFFVSLAYKKGQQVWGTYGFRNSTKLLADYGIICWNNENDSVTITLPDSLLEGISNLDAKNAFLEQNDMPIKYLFPWYSLT